MMNDLWNILPHPSPEHVVRLFARSSDSMIGDFARNPQEIQRFVDNVKGMNQYISLNPTKSTIGTKHSSEDVTHWSFLLFDIDPVKPDADPLGAADMVLRKLCGLFGKNLVDKHRPTIVDSGRGVQLWFRGQDIEFVEGGISRSKVRKIMSYWLTNLSKRFDIVEGCKLDTSVSDLPRVTRLPGTVNLKTGREAKILQYQEKPFSWLFNFLIRFTPDEVFEEPIIIRKPGQPWWSVVSHLSMSSREYLEKGKCEPGRHKVAFHTAKSFYEFGISKLEAWKALKMANKLAGEEEELKLDQLQHCLDEGYKNAVV